MPDDGPRVTRNEAAQRLEVRVDGLLGRLEYARAGKRLILTHTEVPAAIAGRGIGSLLVRAALDDARAQRLEVIPRCSFVRTFIERHPEYRRLVATQGSSEP